MSFVFFKGISTYGVGKYSQKSLEKYRDFDFSTLSTYLTTTTTNKYE